MATWTVARATRMASLLLAALAALIPAVEAQNATIRPEQQVPDWAMVSTMSMRLATESGSLAPYPYFVVPLTAQSGLNQTAEDRSLIQLRGTLIPVDAENFDDINQPDDVAYLSCDEPEGGSSITASTMINTLMASNPRAIILYSLTGMSCSLEGDSLTYQSIFTMTDPRDAGFTLEIANTTNEADVVQVLLTGNVTVIPQDDGDRHGGNNSAVAMSILYSITGLITLLFLVIIATGAIRAHRYPERYGPRSAYGGRPRQSRAKGIARAVLETIPIVKFGDPHPAKPDPAYDLDNISELETAAAKRRDENSNTATPAGVVGGAAHQDSTSATEANGNAKTRTIPQMPAAAVTNGDKTAVGDEHLGCSICTDDFSVGEDVRVLPCNHKFHPACVDPWLINVSGTCPLCRLDLRPQKDQVPGTPVEQEALAPPLEVEGTESDGSSTHRRRGSRLLDLGRLRHASTEERIQALRQLRNERRQDGAADNDSDDRGRRARLAAKLKDKFRIRTRPQPPTSPSRPA